MPDQFIYYNVLKAFVPLIMIYSESPTVENASWMLALIPLPYIETIQSLGFFNRFLVTILTIWLYSSKNLTWLASFVFNFLSKLAAI